MKSVSVVVNMLASARRRRNLLVLVQIVAGFCLLVLLFSSTFHVLMAHEGRSYSWSTSLYWTMVVMSTLGFGDITFQSELGRLFSVVVLMVGTIYMLILLPFAFIQFFYLPWMDAQDAARAPRELPEGTSGHVIFIALGTVERAFIRLLQQFRIGYVLLVPDLREALQLHDDGVNVMVGDLDAPESYLRARVDAAAVVVSTRADTTNSNVAFTVRECSSRVQIVATAASPASVDILELAGCNHVLELGEMLGKAMARRVLGRDGRSQVIGRFGDLLVADAAATGTALAGRTLAELRLRQEVGVNVVGVWDRGCFRIASSSTRIQSTSVLLFTGVRADLDRYDDLYRRADTATGEVVVLGGGTVGRFVARTLARKGVRPRVVEKDASLIRQSDGFVHGDAAELEILEAAGIRRASAVLITTGDDDMNIYLTIYCRRLRPDIQVIGRVTQERNVTTMYRAGADFVLSFASLRAEVLFNMVRRGNILTLAEGLSALRVPVPPQLIGKSLAESEIRQRSGCNVMAVMQGAHCRGDPDPTLRLTAGDELVIVGDALSEKRFRDLYLRV